MSLYAIVLQVSSSGGGAGAGRRRRRRAMWVDAGIHAREWISITTALYFIQQVCSDPPPHHGPDGGVLILTRSSRG